MIVFSTYHDTYIMLLLGTYHDAYIMLLLGLKMCCVAQDVQMTL